MLKKVTSFFVKSSRIRKIFTWVVVWQESHWRHSWDIHVRYSLSVCTCNTFSQPIRLDSILQSNSEPFAGRNVRRISNEWKCGFWHVLQRMRASVLLLQDGQKARDFSGSSSLYLSVWRTQSWTSLTYSASQQMHSRRLRQVAKSQPWATSVFLESVRVGRLFLFSEKYDRYWFATGMEEYDHVH